MPNLPSSKQKPREYNLPSSNKRASRQDGRMANHVFRVAADLVSVRTAEWQQHIVCCRPQTAVLLLTQKSQGMELE